MKTSSEKRVTEISKCFAREIIHVASCIGGCRLKVCVTQNGLVLLFDHRISHFGFQIGRGGHEVMLSSAEVVTRRDVRSPAWLTVDQGEFIKLLKAGIKRNNVEHIKAKVVNKTEMTINDTRVESAEQVSHMWSLPFVTRNVSRYNMSFMIDVKKMYSALQSVQAFHDHWTPVAFEIAMRKQPALVINTDVNDQHYCRTMVPIKAMLNGQGGRVVFSNILETMDAFFGQDKSGRMEVYVDMTGRQTLFVKDLSCGGKKTMRIAHGIYGARRM